MIYLGADHRGFKLKEKIKDWLKEWGVEFTDLGNQRFDPVDDFPDYAAAVSRQVAAGKGQGIVLCGSGGMALVANKFKGVRAVETWNVQTAKHAKAHDDANILMIASDFVDEIETKKMVKVWLDTPLKQDEKYRRRLAKIISIEEENYA